ncbi:creatininase family protein [Pararhizobium mangrovi]|uniref:Creatininase family protein n=1 Tax=Pararhizobium mangrovi TaxID=2590452 RepID=A0A506U255_9HYPH|nr:creatininase family protein [Pararhizobium mangrovi]TPW27548.1 creatininase family protein [Pararhizobium mangrovi]
MNGHREIRLDRLTSPEIAELVRDTHRSGHRPLAVLPVGAIEQHGPHLPTGTDIALSSAVAEAAVYSVPDAVLTAPVPYGVSPHHRDFAGTMSLRAQTFVAILNDLAADLWEDGFTPVFLNGHGGNRAALGVVVSDLGEVGVCTAAITYFEHIAQEAAEILPDAAGGTGHAGALETSLMLHLRPESVRCDRIPAGTTPPAWPDPHLYAKAAPTVWRRFSHINPTGVIGTPSQAEANAGAQLFHAATTAVADLLSRFQEHYGRI